MHRSADTIAMAMDAEDWPRARREIEHELLLNPRDHWLLTRLCTTYYEEKDYTKALQLARRAYRIAPRCPLVRWDYAAALDMSNHTKEAVRLWKSLLRQGLRSLANDPCSEGKEWTRALMNDCRYRLAMANADLGDLAAANRYRLNFLRKLKEGVSSVYNDEAARRLAEAIARG